MQTREALICEPLRTPVGRFGGVFKDLTVQQLGATVVKGLMERTGLPGDAVEDVLFAQCYPSMDAPALGRVVALDAGLPITAAGLQLDRRCGSGLQAVIYAALQVATGASDVVLAGGAESMSNAPFYTTQARWGIKGEALRLEDALARGRVVAGGVNFPVPGGMIETAENLRKDYAISRQEQDAFSVQSHARAVGAQGRGDFDAEIVPVTVKGRKGDTVVSVDEHPRPGTTMESLAALKPLMIKSDPEATVTAGNASGQNDGASACVIASREAVDKYGLRPFGKLVASTEKALSHAGLQLKDIDLIELNEAFAAQALAVTREWKFAPSDFERMNVNGSGISLGHPVGATGGRILATLLHEMKRRDVRYGLETMCIGGGQGLAAIFERAA
jgi:acetyl-CoA C-acetyltransferase